MRNERVNPHKIKPSVFIRADGHGVNINRSLLPYTNSKRASEWGSMGADSLGDSRSGSPHTNSLDRRERPEIQYQVLSLLRQGSDSSWVVERPPPVSLSLWDPSLPQFCLPNLRRVVGSSIAMCSFLSLPARQCAMIMITAIDSWARHRASCMSSGASAPGATIRF